MSQKILLTTAVLAVAFTSTQTDALKTKPKATTFDEEEWNGEIYGEANGGSGRPTDWKVGGKITFDEDVKDTGKYKSLKPCTALSIYGCQSPEEYWRSRGIQAFDEDEWEGFVDVNYSNRGGLGVGVGIQHRWEEEQEQKINVGKALKKAANVLVKANELGLLEEEEWNGEVYGEYGRQNGQTNWKVGGKITFDEEEAEQKFKLGKALKKAANVIVKAHELGVLEEEMVSAQQSIDLRKALKKTATVLTKAQEIGLLEQDEELQIKWDPNQFHAVCMCYGCGCDGRTFDENGKVVPIKKPTTFDEEQGGEIYGEYGRQNGQTNWKVGGRYTFEEDQLNLTLPKDWEGKQYHQFGKFSRFEEQGVEQPRKPKWSHNGFKPKFQKPSSLHFQKAEKF